MDPDTNVQEQWFLLTRIPNEDSRGRMADLRDALSVWVKGGGFKPRLDAPRPEQVRAWLKDHEWIRGRAGAASGRPKDPKPAKPALKGKPAGLVKVPQTRPSHPTTAAQRAQARSGRTPPMAFRREDWHEEDGFVLWWVFPICEPPIVRDPRAGLSVRYTHWTRIDVPEQPK